MAGKQSPQYKTLFDNSDKVISALADNNLANKLANTMKARKLIGRAVFEEATNAGPRVTESMRVRALITALLSKIELKTERYGQFLDILESDDFEADAEAATALLPRNP